MKKIALIVLISLIGLFAEAQAPHPALCHKFNNEPYPAFFSIQPPFTGFVGGDWIGVYSHDNMMCYGAESVGDGYARGQFPGYADDPQTDKVDGFKQDEVMFPFIYSRSENKFYELLGTFKDYRLTVLINEMKYAPLNLYTIDNVCRGKEINLSVDPELAEVIFKWIDFELPVVTGGSDAVKLKFISQNTTAPTFMVAIGKGIIEKRWDGYYYKFDKQDVNVIINAVGQNNFTGQMVTDQLNIQLDQSAASNTIFEDDNVLIYLNGDQVWLRVKAEKLSGYVLRNDGGTWKRLYQVSSKTRGYEVAFITGQYSKSWKGQTARIQYLYYVNGKMISKTFTEKTFTF